MVTNAKGSLLETRKCQKLAKNGAQKAKAQCINARDATSGVELMEYMRNAEQASEDAMNMADKARVGYLLLKDELEGLDLCEIAQSPIANEDTPTPEEPQFEDESLYQPLREWLVTLARALYDKIPERLEREYAKARFPPGCKIDGFDVKIRIDVLESSQQLVLWISKESCDDFQK